MKPVEIACGCHNQLVLQFEDSEWSLTMIKPKSKLEIELIHTACIVKVICEHFCMQFLLSQLHAVWGSIS